VHFKVLKNLHQCVTFAWLALSPGIWQRKEWISSVLEQSTARHRKSAAGSMATHCGADVAPPGASCQ
jgi:hypothetical protein